VSQRRRVRVADSFFEQLDELLGPHRGPNGEPSATDFLVMELPAVVERFATDFDGLPLLEDDLGGGRLLIAPGVLVEAFAVYGLLMPDDSIELVGLNMEKRR
jgi:hypothetical protein